MVLVHMGIDSLVSYCVGVHGKLTQYYHRVLVHMGIDSIVSYGVGTNGN